MKEKSDYVIGETMVHLTGRSHSVARQVARKASWSHGGGETRRMILKAPRPKKWGGKDKSTAMNCVHVIQTKNE